MNGMNFKPFITKVLDSLSDTDVGDLYELMNKHSDAFTHRSLIDANNLLTNEDKGVGLFTIQLDEETIRTGYLLFNDDYCVLLGYVSNSERVVEYLIANNNFKVVKEYLTTDFLRHEVAIRAIEVGEQGSITVQADDIDSGDATEGQVLAADGDGGAKWENLMNTITESTVETGDAVKLFGFDSQGNLVSDDIPEGITVDETIIEDSPNAVAGGAVYDALDDINTELENKANVDGNYPTMTVGLADNLTTTEGITDTTPFVFQSSGGEADITTGYANLKSLRGNTVAFNQLVDTNTTSLVLLSNHRYLTQISGVRSIVSGTGQTISVDSSNNDMVIDLTIMFGVGNEPTSVVEFNRLFPKPYYEYNAGGLMSCQSSAYKIVGYNQYDNSNPNEYIRVISGQTYTIEGTYTSVELYDYDKNLIDTITTSSVVMTNDTHFVKINSGSTDTCFHLTWSGSKTGYEEYYTETYDLPNIELKSAGNSYDELKPDGTLIRRIGVIDLGTLTWAKETSNNGLIYFRTYGINNSIAIGEIGKDKISCSKYPSIGTINTIVATTSTFPDKTITQGLGGYAVSIRDSSYDNSDATTFKNSLSGVYLYYELATPTETQDDSYAFQELTKIDDYGTQEFISSKTIQILQGAEFTYLKNLKDFLRRIGNREDIDYDPEQIVSQAQLANYLKTITGYDATKIQTLKNVSGTLTWVDDEGE